MILGSHILLRRTILAHKVTFERQRKSHTGRHVPYAMNGQTNYNCNNNYFDKTKKWFMNTNDAPTH